MLNFFKNINHPSSEEEILAKERLKQLKILKISKFFNTDWYLSKYTDVAKAGVDPVEHYLMHGANEGRDPSDVFNTLYYLSVYKDVRNSQMNPLVHYIIHGKNEGRSCRPQDNEKNNQNEQHFFYTFIKSKFEKFKSHGKQDNESLTKGKNNITAINYLNEFRRNCLLSREIHRPLLIVGSGPSNNYFDKRRVPANPVVFRVNLFMLESDYKFGQNIDAVFWSIYRRIVHCGLQISIENNIYKINNFFRPPNLIKHSLSIFKKDTAMQEVLFQPKYWHWDMFRLIPEFDDYFFNRKYGGLPTTAFQAVATGLILGFRNIYLSGIDLYRPLIKTNNLADNRYAHSIPKYILPIIAKEHTKSGYEANSHSEEIDRKFLTMLATLYPDAKIYCSVPESPLSEFTEIAPVYADHFSPVTSIKTKNLKRFHKAYRSSLYKNFKQLGEVHLINETLKGWAWDPEKPDSIPLIQLLDDKNNILEEFTPNRYQHDLDMGSIGLAKNGFEFSIHSHIASNKIKHLFIRYKDGLDLDGSPISLTNNSNSNFLKAPKRKGSGRKGIQSISKGPDHFWYENNDSLNAEKAYLNNPLPDSVKRVLIISNNFSLTTGVARSISHYMNALLNIDSIKFTSIELEMNAPAVTIASDIENADFVIFNSIGLFMNHPGLANMVADCGTNRCAIYIHETSWGLNLFKELHPDRHADLMSFARHFNFFCVSRKQANFVREIFGATSINVVYETTTLPKPIHLAPSEESLNIQSSLRIVMSGTLQPRKGVTLFSYVADIAAKKNLPWKFYWVGHELENYAHEIYKSPNVEFIGRLDGQEYIDFLHECDIFFLSSEDDPFPLACLEAIKCFKKLVVFKESGISEILHGVNGTKVYDNYVPEEAYNALQSVSTSNLDTEIFLALSKEFNVENFTIRFNHAIKNCIHGKYIIEKSQ